MKAEKMLLSVLILLGCSGCGLMIPYKGYAQGLVCEQRGHCQECVDASGHYHRSCSYEDRDDPPSWRRQRRQLNRIIDRVEWRNQWEMEIRAENARRAWQACQDGRQADIAPHERERCAELLQRR